VVEVEQVEEMPNLLELSLLRRMGVDYDGQLNEAGRHDQLHENVQRYGTGNNIALGNQSAFSCAEVRAKFANETMFSEEALCLDISDANGNASCCKDSPRSCCLDPDNCTLDDAFAALDMIDLCNNSALVETIQVDYPRGDEERDDIAGNGAAETLGDPMRLTDLGEGNMATASIMATINLTAALPEQKRQIEEQFEALRAEYSKHPHSQVENSLLNNAVLTYALEELRQIDLFEQSKSKVAKPVSLFRGAIPNNLEPWDFQQRVAGGAAGVFANLVQGQAPDLTALLSVGLEIIGLINPVLSFFAGIFMSFLGGNPNDALIKYIMKEVDKKIRRDRARALSLQLKDLLEELSWMPGMVEKANPEVGISWWLIVQHDLAVKKSLVFHDKCIQGAPWNSITRPSLMEANSSFQSLAMIRAHGADTSPDKPVKPALVEVGTSSNRRVVRTHDAGTSLDRSIHGKGGGPTYDDCDYWNHDEVAVELQWVFSELHLNILSIIAELRPVFLDDLKPRVNQIAHEYAGLLQSGYDKFISWRISKIHQRSYCPYQRTRCRGGRQEGVHDEFLGETHRNTNHANYKNGKKNELEARKTQRVEKLMCFSRAAAGHNVGDCGARR
jgi:hypothetical protein